MTRLLVTADLHLEKGMDYAEDRLAEQESVWAWIVKLAVNHECDAILFGGDATEYRAPSSAARAAFQRPLVGLDVPVLAIPGNHDVKHPRYPTALQLMAPSLGGSLLQESHLPEVHAIGGVAVATLPWTPMGAFGAQRNGKVSFGEAAQMLVAMAEGLARIAEEEYPGTPRVLLGHWAIDASYTPTGHSAADFHEPVLPLAELQGLDYDLVAMGHVHKPQVWLADTPGLRTAPHVLVPGSPMPLDFGEAECDHGVWLWDLDAGEYDFIPIESRPFRTVELDADEAISIGDGFGVGWDVDEAIVRVRFTATEAEAARINVPYLRRALLDAGAHRVWQVAPTIERAARPRAEGMTTALTPMQAVDLWLEGRGEAPEGLRDRAQQVIETVAP